jgi:mxaJ protein
MIWCSRLARCRLRKRCPRLRQRVRQFGWLAFIALVLIWATVTTPVSAQYDELQPGVLRVCADPNNLPFSNKKGQGFENKLAELIAKRMGRTLQYSWYEEVRGGMSMPLSNGTCDIVMGYTEGTAMIEDTNPYYYTSYALFYRADDTRLQGVRTLSDPRLRNKRIGVLARTPPASMLVTSGLASTAVPFETSVVEAAPSPVPKIFDEIASGKLDAAILWGPIGGYFSRDAATPIAVVPLVNETAGPATVYGITMGIRPNEPQWKHALNKIITDNQAEINAILLSYNVPLLEPDGTVIKSAKAD